MHKIDFIEVKNDKIVPIEVKYKEKINDKELNSCHIFSNKFKLQNIVLLSKNIQHKKYKLKNVKIEEIPYFV